MADRDPSRYVSEEDGNVTPEEQAQFDQFADNMFKLIYTADDKGGQVRPEVLQALQAANEQQAENLKGQAAPPHIITLATLAVEITQRLDDTAREAGQPLEDSVLIEGGKTVIEELGQVAEAAGIYDYSEDDLSGALAVAADMYRDKAIADGRATEDGLKQEFSGLLEADDAGTLNEFTGVNIPQKEGMKK